MNNEKTMNHTLFITNEKGDEVCRFTVRGKMVEDNDTLILDVSKSEANALALQFAYWNLNALSGGSNYGMSKFRKDGIEVAIRCEAYSTSYFAENAYFLCEYIRHRDNRSFNFTNINGKFTNTNANK